MRFAFVPLLCAAVAAALIAPPPPAAWGASLHIEAEDYVASSSSEDLYVSGGVLYGLDFPNQWVRYNLPAFEPGRYTVVVKCWGELETPYHLQGAVDGGSSGSRTVELNFLGLGSCGT